MANAVGPVFVGGFEEFVVQGESDQYTLLYLPDLNNDKLQAEGKAPVYYWVPGEVRMARKGDGGDFKFHHTHFVGVMGEESHVGVDESDEVQGGVLAFTATSRYPTTILQQAQEQLLERFRGSDEAYWGWRTSAAPMFRIAPISSNRTAVTNLAPDRTGVAPAENLGGGGGSQPQPSPAGDGGPPTGGPGTPGAGPVEDRLAGENGLSVRSFEPSGPVPHGRGFEPRSNLDAWAFQLQGQGAGSVTGGENAYSALMGAYPSEIIWAGFHGAYSPITVAQHLLLPMWSQEIYLRVHGRWRRIFDHFSAHANARSLWVNADVQAEMNRMITRGDIEVEMHIDGTIPGADEMEKEIQKRSDLVFNKFMEQAQKMIFDPPAPEVEPAQARRSGGFLGGIFGGGGVSLKARRDVRDLELNYEETRHHRYNQATVVSSSMKGFYNEIQADPDAERKYFTRLVLGDLGRKIYTVSKPVVRWRKPENEYIGDPVSFMDVQVGYPDTEGAIDWRPHVFQSTDSDEETSWVAQFVRRRADEVENAPEGWTPGKTFVKRTVHLDEPMGATDDPYVKVFVERNEIEIDPPEGTLTSDQVFEVRADSAGKLEIEITGIDVTLQDNSQVVEVEVKPLGRNHAGHERAAVRFLFKHDDQDRSRILEIFTGQPDYVPHFQYRVHVKVKGTLMTQGMSWSGPWETGNANGSFMVHVPRMDEEGVENVVRFSPREVLDRFNDQAPSASAPVDPAPVEPAPSSSGPSRPPGRMTAEERIGGYTIATPPE